MQIYTQNNPQGDGGLSYWRNVTTTSHPEGEVTLAEWLRMVRAGEFRSGVERVRGVQDEATQKKRKRELPCITPSARFVAARKEDAGHWQCNLICIDIDAQDNPTKTPDELRALAVAQYQQDPNLLAVHTSTRGGGLALYYRYEATADQISKTMLKNVLQRLSGHWQAFGVKVDMSCKEVSRARYASYDPEALCKTVDAGLVWRYYPEGQTATQTRAKAPEPEPAGGVLRLDEQPQERGAVARDGRAVYASAPRLPEAGAGSLQEDDLRAICDYVCKHKIDFTGKVAQSIGCSDYDAYTKLAFACVDAGQGVDLFHRLCEYNPTYNRDEAARKFAECQRNNRGLVKVRTIFYFAKLVGIPTRSERIKEAMQDIASCIRKVGKGGGFVTKAQAVEAALEVLMTKTPNIAQKELEFYASIGKEMVNNPAMVKGIPSNETNSIAAVEEWLQDFPIEHNAVLDRTEIGGRLMTDRHLNDLWLSAKKTVSSKVKREEIDHIINSHSTPTYNPFLRYLEGIEGKQSDGGQVDALLSCLTFTEPQHGEFYRTLVVKWLLGVVAAMRGDFSVICLVLVGRQGVGKTTFFRGILPDELQPYYAESKLDGEKDSLELLASKLIICDDEFSGKSKKDARRFKELISKDVITVRAPYARYSSDRPRVAVWCGSSNSNGVLVDSTGNRRIIPVGLAALDFAKFASIDRDGLWAQLDRMHKASPQRFHLTRDEVEALAGISSGKYDATIREREAIEEFLEVPENEDATGAVVITATQIAKRIEERGKYTASVQVINDVMQRAGFQMVRAKRDYPETGVKRTCRGWLVKDNPVSNYIVKPYP